MATYDDEPVGAFGEDPLSEESKEVLRRAQVEMTGWITTAVKQSTDGLKVELTSYVKDLESSSKEITGQIDALYVDLDKLQKNFGEALASRFGQLQTDTEKIRAATELLATRTAEVKQDLERKKELCAKAGQATVTALKRFAG